MELSQELRRCEYCGELMLGKKAGARFCSRHCADQSYAERARERGIRKYQPRVITGRVCVYCSGEIPVDKPHNARYCSDVCAHTANWRGKYEGLTTGIVGAINELLVAADLLRRGLHVFRAMSPSCPCDLTVLKGSTLLRFEVTTARKSLVTNTISYPKHNPENYDFMALVFPDGTIQYLPSLEDE